MVAVRGLAAAPSSDWSHMHAAFWSNRAVGSHHEELVGQDSWNDERIRPFHAFPPRGFSSRSAWLQGWQRPAVRNAMTWGAGLIGACGMNRSKKESAYVVRAPGRSSAEFQPQQRPRPYSAASVASMLAFPTPG